MRYSFHDTPVGRLLLAGTPDSLALIGFPCGRGRVKEQKGWERHDLVFDAAKRQLDEYFEGTRRQFDLVLAPRGTPFQQRVWRALLAVPYGRTLSYRELAAAIDQPAAVRAVGLANGQNPLPIVIPCHRIIGSDGSLTGYGGGLDIKRFLLRLEGSLLL